MATASYCTLGDYNIKLRPLLGRGAFGTVYKATNTKTGDNVAVKEIHYGAGVKKRSDLTTMAEKELCAILQCNEHPNIVNLLKFFEQDDSFWMVLEYCDKGDLFSYLERQCDSLTRLDIYKIMLQTASAVAYMHSQEPPIVHRDIKLQNILMKTEDRSVVAKVCDLGLAKFYDSHSNYSAAFNLQVMSSTQGTGQYMAPEFSAELDGGTQYTPSVDVYALGLVFLVLLEPNKPHFYPLSVESKKADVFVNIGYEMVQCHKNKRKLPTIIEDKPDDDQITKRMKRIIRNMTKLRFYERKSIHEVVEELIEMLEHIEKKVDKSPPCNIISDIESRLKAACLSPTLRIKKKGNKDTNKRKVEDTALCQNIEVNLKPTTKFKTVKEKQIYSDAWSMEMIGNDLSVCCYDGIDVLSTELEKLHHVPRGIMGSVRGATDTRSGVVVAADNGLFRLNYQGNQEARIDTRSYRDVCYSSGQIIATLDEKPYDIEVYDAQTRQHQRSIPVQCTGGGRSYHEHTLTIHSQNIFIACFWADKVYKYTFDGTMISTYSGSSGIIGKFLRPYICHTNTPEHVLVADWRKNRVQMLYDGEWHELQLEPSPQRPCDAILTQHALYVLQESHLTKYEYK